jgi:hypothetical protein
MVGGGKHKEEDERYSMHVFKLASIAFLPVPHRFPLHLAFFTSSPLCYSGSERVTAARLSAADPKEFILETTGKELSLEAESAAEAKHWVTRVCAVLNHLSQRNAMGGLAAAAAAAAAKAKASK